MVEQLTVQTDSHILPNMHPAFASNPCHRRSRGGFALILVLIALALITALTVFFMSDVGRERRGVDQYSHGSETRHLADTAVNLVQAQINAATKENTPSVPVSWASQPGMIRTYNTTGALSNAYKLYSWDNLVESGVSGGSTTTFDPTSTAEYPASTWSTLPAQYTDLNAPVNGVYPIADPRIANTSSAGTATQTGSVTWDFPGEFAVATDALGYYPPPANTLPVALPMPVKWIYVLQDGSWLTPTSSSGNTASFAGTTGETPTTSNPIVGRIAFWTDDETSKVNVNTASEGSFWDTPKAGTLDEMQFAVNPPIKGEFQRISGHPATTSLSAIFPEMRTGTYNRWTSVGSPSAPASYLGQLKSIYDMVPRIDWSLGGSQGGTYPITSYTAIYSPPANQYPWTDPSTYAITTDTNRLYATADDLWFQPARTANTAFNNYNVTAAQMAQRLFLFTANSRAPETTLFETPRVSLWPVTWPYPSSSFYTSTGVAGSTNRTPVPPSFSPNSDTLAKLYSNGNGYITPQEMLLAYCSTLNAETSAATSNTSTTSQPPAPYYFQRQDPDSPVWDFSAANIQRNLDVVGYLRREIGKPVPGMGNNMSLENKWGSGNADWITLNCFDYSRSLINQYTYNPSSSTGSLMYSFTGLQDSKATGSGTTGNHAEVNAFTSVPLRVALTTGGTVYSTEGAYPALKEAAVVFYATARNEPAPPTTAPVATDVSNPDKWTNLITTTTCQTTKMKAVMLFSFAQMNPGIYSYKGNSTYSPAFWIKVTSLSTPFTVNGAPINLPHPTNHSVQWNTLQPYSGVLLSSVAPLFYQKSTVAKIFTNTSNGAATWSLTSDDITVDPTKTTFLFGGTTIQVDIYAPDPSGNLTIDPTSNPNCLVSSQQMDFSKWSQTLPTPVAPRWNVRQALMQTTGTNVTGGVLMPTYTTVSSTNPNWQTEIVPAITQFGQMTSISQDPRTTTGTLAAGQGTVGATAAAGNENEPLMYLYKDSTGLLMSRDFASRVVGILGNGDTSKSPCYLAENSSTYYGKTYASGTSCTAFGGEQQVASTQAYQLITPYDTVISMVSDPTLSTAGDPRLMGRGQYSATGTTKFVRIDTAFASAGYTPAQVFNFPGQPWNPLRTTAKSQYHALGSPGTTPMVTGYRPDFKWGSVASATLFAQRGSQTQHGSYPSTVASGGSNGLLLGRNVTDSELGVEANVTMILDPTGDWTALPGNSMDGGYLTRPDQEYQSVYPGSTYNSTQELNVPYFEDNGLAGLSTSGTGTKALAGDFFVPNRQVPSPVILGTLPSSMTTGWQTLDFCPNPAKAMSGGIHPGLGVQTTPSATGAPYTTLPDHLLLDLFWMPVAEPYPISEQFSTAGKVNLNYAMMPFPYIKRKTALDALLKSVCITALPSNINNFSAYYKSYGLLYQFGLHTQHTRYPVNVDATLKSFDYKFNSGDIFRSASQICDMFLYPNDTTTPNQLLSGVSADDPPSISSIKSWWANQALTADNAREDPYNAIYSRITTKSNTFTVHWKVQSLKKRLNSTVTTWTENQDVVTSELRGSTLIERYLDPNATNLPDYATDTTPPVDQPLSQFYKWRVAAENYFRP